MARGWESKSVEEQIESARSRLNQPKVQLSPEQMEKERRRDSLLLHRTRVQRDLAGCADGQYRTSLEQGLAYLEAQLAELL